MNERHLELLAQALRPRQPGYAVITGLVAFLGVAFQIMAWIARDSFAAKIALALCTGLPCAAGVAVLLRNQLRKVHPLVHRLRTSPRELAGVSLAYVVFPHARLAELKFEFRDGRRWSAYVPEIFGAELQRAAQALVSGPLAQPVPR